MLTNSARAMTVDFAAPSQCVVHQTIMFVHLCYFGTGRYGSDNDKADCAYLEKHLLGVRELHNDANSDSGVVSEGHAIRVQRQYA